MRIHFINPALDFGGPSEASGIVIVWDTRCGDVPEKASPSSDLRRIDVDRGETVPARTEVLCLRGSEWWGGRVADEE